MVASVPTTNIAAAPTATPASIIIYALHFLSRDNFIPGLLNPLSQAFQNKARQTKQQLEPIYSAGYDSFIRVNVTRFRNGSTITFASLIFNSTASPPTFIEIITTLLFAVQTGQVSGLNIEPSSITVNGTVIITSGASSHTSIFTATCLVVISQLLSYVC
ncbi:hypothetical protein AAFF_G00323340 [Aldrovandia affinis]|uniref:SEA domain-containing protein n=1 Tax=Aldrovandia affinis TaxID=143900 RepID=A0AAD7R6U0_9TELE|nr:hypothetical protein AAFF_G00323340 [Aldrovandia affinis]